MENWPPLEREIRRRIAAAGPMPVAHYMALCLADPEHGYYTTRDPLGSGGDFITAPEVSQIFGELIGLWIAAVWKQMGAPEQIRIVELGPGRGTLMKDAMRAAQTLAGFRDAARLHLIDISPPLVAMQQQTLQWVGMPVHWHREFAEVPDGAAIVVANEFFDALPLHQAVKAARGWHERQIGIGDDGKLAFTMSPQPVPHFERLLPPALRDAADDSIFEWRDDAVAFQLGRRLSSQGGAALAIDYGHGKSGIGDTFQAVGAHAYADPLVAPGSVDLTAHVDFQALARGVEAAGAIAYGPIEQRQLLRALGIEQRAATLKAAASRTQAADIEAAKARLIEQGRSGMGALFKAAAFAHPSVGAPPGFES
jgi:SAM-dependent MidA family methyltransferase